MISLPSSKKLFWPSIAFVSIFFLSGCQERHVSSLVIDQLKCNWLENPAGTGATPDFSWTLTSRERNKSQSAWQIIVGSSTRDGSDMWDSGIISSTKTSFIRYEGKPLESGHEYLWKVRVWDETGKPSPWSKTGTFITGLFTRDDWNGAKWIGYEEIPDSLLLVPGVHGSGNKLGNVAVKRMTVPLFRKEFSTGKKIVRALAFVSGLGQYELYINGNRIGDRYLSPGWTDYRKTCLYNTFDVTRNIEPGSNTIGVIAGNGFYNINRERYRKLVIAYGAPKIIMALRIFYSDGSGETVVSDESWKTSPSPVVFTSIYGGEDYDATLEQQGWNENGFNDSGWKQAILAREPSGALLPETDYPVTISETIGHRKITQISDTCFIYDFGQNASGIISIKVIGRKGQTIRLIPGELRGDDSLVTQQATGGPYYFSYKLKGDGEEVWMPRFTYYGFRYLQVNGAVPAGTKNSSGQAVINNIQLQHTRNSSPVIGNFRCSNELFNSIYSLINWAIKSNLASVVTDCPHREKLGWLEQTHLMGNSVKFIYDIHNLYDKVIDDMIGAQLENGLVPDIAPEFVPFEGGFRDSPEWGSACVILPWDMYEWYGDIEAVKRAYPMMKKYLGYLLSKSENHILSHGLGDWYDLGPKFPGEAQLTPKAVTATSIFFYDARLLSKMAGLIGEKTDSVYYSQQAEDIRQAFNGKFFDPVSKVYSTGSQTAFSMPLFFGMVDDSIKKQVEDNLTRSVIDNNKALTAGDIGYRYLIRALEEAGQSQLIFEMNSRTDVPGYGYQLSRGATALTESWPALKYVSNNHMMLGHLMEWLYSGVGGIRQAEGSSSWDTILFSPDIVGDLTWAETSCKTVHGTVACKWKVENGNFTMTVEVPANSRAIVAIPAGDPGSILESGSPVSGSKLIRIISVSQGKTLCSIPSGQYTFTTTYKRIKA